MVDYLSLAISHGVLILAFWRMLWRNDLDVDPPPAEAANGTPGTDPRA